jgi:hypothetical protein
MALIYKVLFSSISTFETPPLLHRVCLLLHKQQLEVRVQGQRLYHGVLAASKIPVAEAARPAPSFALVRGSFSGMASGAAEQTVQ